MVEVGSRARRRGARRAAAARPATADERRCRRRARRARPRQMGRELDITDIKELLVPQLRAPALGRGRRALPDLRQLHDGLPDLLLHDRRGRHRPRRASTSSARSAGTRASRSTTRYIHGGAVRRSARSRYRQWMTHKLATWIDQFGSSGCVGCGRCITWCPVGIDITEEAARDPRERRRPAMQTLEELIARRAGRSPGCARRPARADRRLRRATCTSSAGAMLFREGEPADAFFLIRHGSGRARGRTRPAAARSMIETLERRRRGRLVVAVPAVPLAVRRARARRRAR